MSPDDPVAPDPKPALENTLAGVKPVVADPPPVDDPAKAEADKPEADKAKKPDAVAPLTATDLVIPEGLTVDEPVRDEFLQIMNNQEFSPKDRMNALIALQAKVSQAASEKGSKLWDDTVADWAEQTRQLPDLGGDKLAETLGGISRLIEEATKGKDGSPDPKFATDIRELMDLTGVGNHPMMVKFLHNVARKLVIEGRPVQVGRPAASAERTQAQILFGS